MHSMERAEKIVLECLEKSKEKIVILPKGLPWKAVLIQKDVLFVVYPSSRGGYNAQAVPVAIDSQQCKKLFPEEWRGKGSELDEITGLKGMIFCHSHGYLLAAQNMETAVEACKITMNHTDPL